MPQCAAIVQSEARSAEDSIVELREALRASFGQAEGVTIANLERVAAAAAVESTTAFEPHLKYAPLPKIRPFVSLPSATVTPTVPLFCFQ